MKLPKISQEPMILIDATPNKDYPLRVLKAYRENCNCKWTSNPDNPAIKQRNEDNDKRAVLLDKAINTLKRKL